MANHRNPIAENLRTRRYRPRVEVNRRRYDRKRDAGDDLTTERSTTMVGLTNDGRHFNISAAADLLEACEESIFKAECGEKLSIGSVCYNQMKLAVSKAFDNPPDDDVTKLTPG